MASHYTVAEEMLGAASAQRGLGGMSRTAAPIGPNMMDGGAASKVGVNTQPYKTSDCKYKTFNRTPALLFLKHKLML